MGRKPYAGLKGRFNEKMLRTSNTALWRLLMYEQFTLIFQAEMRSCVKREPVASGETPHIRAPKRARVSFLMYSHEKAQKATKKYDFARSMDDRTTGLRDYWTTGRQDYGTTGLRDEGAAGL